VSIHDIFIAQGWNAPDTWAMPTFKVPVLPLSFLAFSVAIAAGAQQPPAPPSGTVTGHVTCSDTQRPARFASVLLFGVPASVTSPATLDNAKDETQVAAVIKANMAMLNSTNLIQTQTDAEGAFKAAGVAPGDYYVFAAVPGYVQPMYLVKAAIEGGADPQKPLPGVPMVHVAAARESLADISIDRGAAISGKVVWEDGSPVTKANVMVVPVKGEKPLPTQYSMVAVGSMGSGGLLSITDDLGHFRLFGLAPGQYYVKATLQTKSEMSMQRGKMNFNMNQLAGAMPLVIFAPAAFHQASAKAVTLSAGQTVDDEEVTINLTGLHSVSGRIASVEDHHAINSGTISLADPGDKQFSRSASVNEDGSFTVTFVPPGTFDLKVEDAADTVPSTKKSKGLLNFASDEPVRSYDDGKQQVIVADDDVTGQNIDLTPSKTLKKPVDIGGVVGGLLGASEPPASPDKQ
jgi:hypothetical protein